MKQPQSMTDPAGLLEAAENAMNAGAFDQAHRSFQDYLQIRPADAHALIGASEVLRAIGQSSKIVDIYSNAVAAEPENLDLRSELIDALMAELRVDDAIAMAEKELAANPQYTKFKVQIAQNHVALGDMDLARQLLWECQEADPEDITTIFYLTQMNHKDDAARLEPIMAGFWARRDDYNLDDLLVLGYGRGKVAETLGKYDEAWEAYEVGAKARRNSIRYDEQNLVEYLDLQKRIFPLSEEVAQQNQDVTLGQNLVFVCSLPRSGSTLVEQILASHHQVEGIGEREFTREAFQNWYESNQASADMMFQPAAIMTARNQLLDAMKGVTEDGSNLIVDKSISNFCYAGFLQTILPGAHFIHVVRDPLDTAVSCLATTFHAGNEWSYDQREIGRNIRRHQKLMKYWLKTWPDSFLTVRYEDIVGDIETSARAMVDFCGLEWDPACLEFHKTKRAVMTSSTTQVRKPIYASAKGRASRFDAHLGPLKSALGRAANPDWFLK